MTLDITGLAYAEIENIFSSIKSVDGFTRRGGRVTALTA